MLKGSAVGRKSSFRGARWSPGVFTRAPPSRRSHTSTIPPHLWQTAMHIAQLSASTFRCHFSVSKSPFYRGRNWGSNLPKVTQQISGRAADQAVNLTHNKALRKDDTAWRGSSEPEKLRWAQFSPCKGEVLTSWPVSWWALLRPPRVSVSGLSFHLLPAPRPWTQPHSFTFQKQETHIWLHVPDSGLALHTLFHLTITAFL